MKLSAEGKLRLAVQLAFIAGAGTVAGGAYAQDSGDAKSTTLQGVQVTGSRIKQQNLTTSSSMTVISDKELQLQGTVNVETLLNNVPQTFAGFSTSDSNGATGTATVDLRGLGPQETLVLIDGKRLMPGDPVQSPPSADLNFIPAALVERVEILTGGASAVYGSDAVAGVVNFIMKKDFQGFRIDGQASRTDHSDGTTWDSTLIWGSNFSGGKGNVTLYTGYTKMEAVTEAQRGFSQCAYDNNKTNTAHVCSGSSVIPGGRFVSYDRYYAGLANYVSVTNPNGSANLIDDNGEKYNFAPFNYLQRPVGRFTLGGFAHDEVNTHLDLYGSVMFMDNHTIAQVAPSGDFGSVASIPCSNPLLSPQQVDYLCTQAGLSATDNASVGVLRRTPEVGNRDDDLRHTDYRIVIGARGDIIKGLSYDVSAQRGQVLYTHQYLGYTNGTNINNALDVITGPALLANGKANPLAGQPECQSVYNGTDPNCVPLNVFQRNSISPAAAAYITGIGEAQATQVEQVVNASTSADLGQYGVKTPWAKNGLGLAGGFEYRTESLDYRPDANIESGNLGGLGGPSPAVSGAFNVHEFFTEAQLPVVENMPGIKQLELDASFRLSKYTLAGEAHNFKGAFKYAPTNDVLVRGSYARATRAPSVSELFLPQAFGLAGASDPCSGATPTLTQAQCANTGLAAARYGNLPDCNAGQCNILTGGNTALTNELSVTRSAGIVFTPRVVKNFSMSVDWFDITLRHAISTLPFGAVLNECGLTGQAAFCDLIHRGPTGALSGGTTNGNYVTTTNINTGLKRTKGFDTELDYRLRLRDVGLGNNGQLVFQYISTYLYNYSSEDGPGLGVYECVGRFGLTCGTPNPRYRQKVRLTWDMPSGVSVSANWRYFGDVKYDGNSLDPHLNNFTNGTYDKVNAAISAKQYMDLSAAYALPIKQVNLTLRAGISNIFGQAPPLLNQTIAAPPFGNANTYPNVYDSLGRVMFVGATLDL